MPFRNSKRRVIDRRIAEIEAEMASIQRVVATTGVNLTLCWDQLFGERTALATPDIPDDQFGSPQSLLLLTVCVSVAAGLIFHLPLGNSLWVTTWFVVGLASGMYVLRTGFVKRSGLSGTRRNVHEVVNVRSET